jgi:hypothetical protein
MPAHTANAPDIDALPPVLRRALMAHVPAYFQMSPEDRQVLRAEWAVADHAGIRQYLTREVLGKSKAEIAAIEGDKERLTIAEETKLNRLTQLIRGVGEDYFSWNTFLGEGETALSFKTIGEYDRLSHAFQEECKAKDDDAYEIKPYRGLMYCEWARYLKKGEIRYACLYDLAGYVYSHLQRVQLHLLNELVPYEFVAGPDDGKPAGDGFVIWDTRIDAGGYEALHDALRDASFAMLSARLVEMRENAWAKGDLTVWEVEGDGDDQFWEADDASVIFASPAAMDRVRTLTFLKDCASNAGKFEDLKAILDSEEERFTGQMRASYDDLRKTHPKGLVPFKKKHSVQMSRKALKDIFDLGKS